MNSEKCLSSRNDWRPMVARGYFREGYLANGIINEDVKGYFLGYFNDYHMSAFEGFDGKHYFTNTTLVEFTE